MRYISCYFDLSNQQSRIDSRMQWENFFARLRLLPSIGAPVQQLHAVHIHSMTAGATDTPARGSETTVWSATSHCPHLHGTPKRGGAKLNEWKRAVICMSYIAARQEAAFDVDDGTIDPTFDLNESMKSDSAYAIETLCEEWVIHLSFEDRTSLGLFISSQLSTCLGMGKTKTDELAGVMTGNVIEPFENGERSF